jgi:hypothetical protein
MVSDLGDAGRVVDVTLQGDQASVGRRLEVMGRGVLIHTHRDMSSMLHSGKGALSGRLQR